MELLTDDPLAVVSDPDVDIVVEVMGGVDPADSYLRRALQAGKSVVTANKALLAARGHELIELAEAGQVDLYFEAAVAGGVPVIRVLREAFASDRIIAVRGIINGTSNYILSRMTESGIDFGPALKEAQQKGYAEADPTLDVGGGDAAHKLNILATLAYGVKLELAHVATSGIDQVNAIDIAFASRFGYVIKPLAVARALPDGTLDLRVHPALVSKKSVLASVNGALNAVYIEGAAVGPCLLSGLGAGALPTAVSVVSDIVDVGRNLRSAAGGRVPQRAFRSERMTVPRVQAPADHRCRFYIRFAVQDRSGVLGKLATSLGNHQVSIEQMVQEGQHSSDPVSVVVLTHPAREGDLRAALSEIDRLDIVAQPTRVLRIEES
jgi:homoserine dehydrogenase